MNIQSEKIMRVQKRKKLQAVNAFGGKCCICGYDKCIEVLGFHHLDKSTKEEKPAYIIMRWKWERVKKELDKCILVCANCHGEIHAAEKEALDIDLRNYIKSWLTKSCECCGKDYLTKDDEQKYCTHSCMHYSQRKVERPSKEELFELIKTINWTQLGKMFKVSDNTVRNWAKKYELI